MCSFLPLRCCQGKSHYDQVLFFAFLGRSTLSNRLIRQVWHLEVTEELLLCSDPRRVSGRSSPPAFGSGDCDPRDWAGAGSFENWDSQGLFFEAAELGGPPVAALPASEAAAAGRS